MLQSERANSVRRSHSTAIRFIPLTHMSQEEIYSMESIREVPYYLAVSAVISGILLIDISVLLEFDSFNFRVRREFLDETSSYEIQMHAE